MFKIIISQRRNASVEKCVQIQNSVCVFRLFVVLMMSSSVYGFVCLLIFLSVGLSVCLHACLPVYLFKMHNLSG